MDDALSQLVNREIFPGNSLRYAYASHAEKVWVVVERMAQNGFTAELLLPWYAGADREVKFIGRNDDVWTRESASASDAYLSRAICIAALRAVRSMMPSPAPTQPEARK
jgi:hypothetical protein